MAPNEQQNPIALIISQLSSQKLTMSEIGEIFNHPSESPSSMVQAVSLAVAVAYWKREMPYEQGDLVMNKIFSYAASAKDSAVSETFFSGIPWGYYLAFDEGEYYHQESDRAIDPSEKYTRPLIEELLKEQGLIG